MSINTNKPATRPVNFTKKDWDTKTIRAYKGLIMLVKGELPKGRFSSMTKAYLYHPVVNELFQKCGIPMEEKYVLNLLFAMVREKTAEHHVVAVSSLRKWFNGGWKVEKPVTYTEPKEPKVTTKSASPKGKKITNESVEKWFSGLSDSQKKAVLNKLAA